MRLANIVICSITPKKINIYAVVPNSLNAYRLVELSNMEDAY